MSEANQAPEPAAKPAGANVIRIVHGAEETSQERLLKKQVPAWVVSGAFHVVILVLFIIVGRMGPPTAKASDAIPEAIVDKPEDEQKNLDLTNTDKGLESELQNNLPIDRQDDQTVDNPVKLDAPVGNDAPVDATQADRLFGAGNQNDLGVQGTDGDVASGNRGAGGTGNQGFAGRSGASRENSLRSGGGNKDSELAVARGLAWLDKKQIKASGHWQYDGTSKGDTIAATGMSLLPFLAAGQTHIKARDPKSGKDANKYQNTVFMGLKYIVANQLPSGTFKGVSNMYAHAIAAVALCEAYGMTGDKSFLLRPAQAAIQYIIKAQATNGSWGYSAGTAGDTSIVGWQIQALKSAMMCKDIPVPEATFKKSVEFLEKVGKGAGSAKSQYGYTSNDTTTPALSAVGLLCRYYTGWGPAHPGMKDGVKKFMAQWMPMPNRFDMYYYYYATQVAHFHEGDEWHKDWNPKMRDMLIKMQVPDSNKDLGGSWDADQGMIGSHCGRLGTTCLALLTLEVYYRHLPLYKRDSTGLKELERGK